MANRLGSWRGQGPLRPQELAEAAVLADISVALIAIGWLLPATTVFIAAATVPMAAVAARNRPRAVLAGAVAAATVAMLIAGTGLALNVAGCAVIGTLLGVGWRRRWRMSRIVGISVAVLWPVAALGADALLTVFSQLRQLALDQITDTWSGAQADFRQIGLVWLNHLIDPCVRWMVGHWALGVPAALLVGIVGSTVVGKILAWPPLARLEQTRLVAPATSVTTEPAVSTTPGRRGEPRRARSGGRGLPDGRDGRDGRGRRGATIGPPPGPVPVRLVDVGHTYPGMATPALRDVSLTIEAGEYVAVVGPNGSGKSTLARILGGRPPSTGAIHRPGAVAPGRPGGTAAIFQRPESQVLGVLVRDDLVWGLTREHGVDVDALLDRVGLGGFADRETAALSGGELQRLAVAAALARRPRLLISDESTAMVDAAGRELLADLLATLARNEGLAVVHVTHRLEEARRADRTLFLDHGRLVDAPAATIVERPGAVVASPTPVGSGRALELVGVGHVYTPRSPWSHRALADIDLTIAGGEAVMVVGHNGSGKSTLAWILAGLLVPSEGRTSLDGHGHGLDRRLGQVALSFQHARLQLLRSTVRVDVRAASGVDDVGADDALRLVGLDPDELGDRSIDQLSGGQQRRVALAGMLARHPSVVVLDEPFAGLDDGARRSLISVLRRLRIEQGLTLILVSHDIEGAEHLVDRVVTLDHGRIVADEVLHPAPAPASSREVTRGAGAAVAGGSRPPAATEAAEEVR